MPISLDEKKEIVDFYKNRLSGAQFIAFVDYRGLSVSDINGLRKQLKESAGSLNVVKFTLLKRAVKDAKLDVSIDNLKGKQIAVAIADQDVVEPSKALFEFGKKNENLEILDSVIDGAQQGPEAVSKLAKLPTREELLAKAVGSIKAPVSNFVGVLSAIPRSLVYALKQIQESKS